MIEIKDPRPTDVSIIIVNWNSLELLKVAIESIRQLTTGINYEIIVVDNFSTKDSSRQQLNTGFPSVNCLLNTENRGFCAATNQGVVLSSGRYLLFLNADTFQVENAIGHATTYMDNNRHIGALGVKHLNADRARTIQRSHYVFPNPWQESTALLGIPLRRFSKAQPELDVEQDVDWVCGSFLMIRRECWEGVGPLDERFFTYGEDIEWCRRAHNSNWPVRFWPGAEFVHLGSSSASSIRDKTFMCFRSQLTYYSKHHSIFAASFYYLAICLRLGCSTLAQFALMLRGSSTKAEFFARLRRQVAFLFLSDSHSGV
jgi:GT2 family glycosyltransferase